MAWECIVFSHLECMHNGCCRKCEQFDTCNSNLKCENDPNKCGVYKNIDIDMRQLLKD